LTNSKESWALLEDLAIYDNESWNDPRDFAKPVKVLAMPQDIPSTSDRCLIKLENQVQRLLEAYRFMKFLEEQTDGEAMINSIKNDKSMWSDQEKKIQKIDRLARSLLIQGLPNDIYSLIDSNKTVKDVGMLLLDICLVLNMVNKIGKLQFCMSMKRSKLLKENFLKNLQLEWKQYTKMMRQNKNLMDINIDALYNILKQNQGDVNDAMGLKKKTIVVTFNPLALIAEKTKVSNRKEKKFYSKQTNNNLRTSSASQSANKKQEYKEGHFTKDCKKAKVKDYEYYKTKMLLAKKDKDEQVLLAEDHAWMESSSDSDQEINANMVFKA
nr:MAK10-like protein [Tanacetum cinerariifolium]